MAKKKDEKDVLIVRDEKTGEISVVAGLNADGTPKRTPAKAENAKDFLRFDRGGDVLDNFLKNFFRQCKEPSRFGFYRVAVEQVDSLLDVMKQLLKDPEANRELLSPHKVDTSGYEKQVAEEKTTAQGQASNENKEQEQETEPQKQEYVEQKQEQKNEQQPESPQQSQGRQGYRPIDESQINWQELKEKWGVDREELEKSGDLKRMLNYGKSDLVKVSPKFGGETFELEVRLSLRKNEDGSIGLVPHFIRKEQKLDEYKGHKFSDEDRKNLRETGNMGRKVDLVNKETGEVTPSFISIDRKTNEITDMAADRVRIPNRIGKTEITPQEQEMLRAGLPVKDKLMERNDGRKFVATLQVNVEKRGVEFVPGTGKSPRTAQAQENKEKSETTQGQTPSDGNTEEKKQRRNTWTNEDGSIRGISKWCGKPLTEEQKADYVAGKTIKLENVTDKQGVHATMYVKFDPEKGRPLRYDTNPDNAQKVAPSNKGRRDSELKLESKTGELRNNTAIIEAMTEDWNRFVAAAKTDKDGNRLNLLKVDGVDSADEKVIGKHLQEIAKNTTTGGLYKKVGEIYGFPVKVISERMLKDGLEFTDNRFVVEGNYKYTYNNGHLAMADSVAAARNFLNALEKIPSAIDQYKEKNTVLEQEIPQLQAIAGKVWKKEDELKQLKSELAALDRKIQLELAPPAPEAAEKKGNWQGQATEGQRQRTVPLDEPPQVCNPVSAVAETSAHPISDRIIITRPGVKFRPG